MTNYDAMARAAELEGQAKAARIRAQGLQEAADRASGKNTERAKQKARELDYISCEVAAGRMCPGGCDTDCGGCRFHASSC
jgi:hypothetical protein